MRGVPRGRQGGREATPPAGRRVVEKTARTRAFSPPAPKPMRVALRAMAWMLALLRFVVWRGLLRLRSRRDIDARAAARLARIIASMRGAAAYLGKQIGMRLDLLPHEYAAALAGLTDAARPMHFADAMVRIEGALGAPLSEVFATLDPEPIASTTIDCLYQAILHSGEKVAIRVLRPGAVQRVTTEVHAIKWAIRMLRHLLPDKSLLIQRVHDEAPHQLLQGVDFVRRARLQRVLHRELKRWRIKRVGVAKVFLDMSDEHVIVTRFVDGVWLHEVVDAVERGDEAAAARLHELQIEPSACARHLLRFSWWATLESYVLIAAPSASHLVVRPGGKIVMVDVGTAVTMTRHDRRLLLNALESFAGHDIEATTDLLLELASPLPPLDVHELSSRVRGALWAKLVAMERRDCPWWERAPTNFWLGLFEVLREFDVEVPMELALAAQSQCVFGQLAFRMRPGMRLVPELRRYRRGYFRRGARVFVREVGNPRKDGGSRFVARPSDLTQLVDRGLLDVESLLERAPMTYMALTHKGAWSLSELLRLLVTVFELAVAVLLVEGGVAFVRGQPYALVEEALALWTSPLFVVALVLLAVRTIRRVLFRLDDVDREELKDRRQG